MEVLLTVEDSFPIKDRGVIIAPPIEDGRIAKAANVSFDAHAPDGTVIAGRGRIQRAHVRMLDGSSMWSWVLVVDEACPGLRAGSKVVVNSSDPADAFTQR